MSARALGPASGSSPGNVYAPRLVHVLEAREEIAARGVSRPVISLILERDGLEFRAGQFAEVGVFGAGEIPLCISSPPGLPDTLWITVRAMGVVSTLLARRHILDFVSLRGPCGNSFPLEACEGGDVLFIAGGMGLAPLRSLLWEMLLHRERYRRIVLFHGARTPHDLLYRWQWKEWQRTGVEIHLATDVGDPEWQKEYDPPRVVGFLNQLFPRIDLKPERTMVFVCGPPLMIHYSCAELARTYGFAPARIVATLERHMKCGIGKCGHCVVVDRYVCMDGPVFRYDELLAMNRIEPPW